MIRSLWKPFFSEINAFQKTFFGNENKRISLILSKSSIIFPSFVGNAFLIYNGKKFIVLQIADYMIGFKFNDFMINRRKFVK